MKKYKITYQDENRVKTKIIESSNLQEESLPSKILTIKPINEKKDLNIFKSKIKIDKNVLISIFYELNIMLQANLMLNDALGILTQNYKEEKFKRFIEDLKKALLGLDSIDNIFKDYRIDIYIVSFLKLCQKNGNINANINALSMLLKEELKIKKDFSKAIRYPFILLISLFLSINIIFYFVVPKFKVIFVNNYESLPFATKTLFNIHTLYMSYFVYLILLFLSIVFLVIYFYLKNKEFEYLYQNCCLKIYIL